MFFDINPLFILGLFVALVSMFADNFDVRTLQPRPIGPRLAGAAIGAIIMALGAF